MCCVPRGAQQRRAAGWWESRGGARRGTERRAPPPRRCAETTPPAAADASYENKHPAPPPRASPRAHAARGARRGRGVPLGRQQRLARRQLLLRELGVRGLVGARPLTRRRGRHGGRARQPRARAGGAAVAAAVEVRGRRPLHIADLRATRRAACAPCAVGSPAAQPAARTRPQRPPTPPPRQIGARRRAGQRRDYSTFGRERQKSRRRGCLPRRSQGCGPHADGIASSLCDPPYPRGRPIKPNTSTVVALIVATANIGIVTEL